MTTNLTPKLQKQIAKEAASSAANFHYYPDSEEYEDMQSAYETGAKKYALKWQEAEQRAARYEKALQLIEQMSDPGDYWKAICDMKAIASEALTLKTSSNGTDNG